MQKEQVYEKLSPVFEKVFGEEIELSETLTASDVDDWDSLTHLRLMLNIEQAFGVKFSPTEIASMKNVGDLVNLILSKK